MDLSSHPSGVTALVYPAQAKSTGAAIILGHGAGAGQQSAFMVGFATALADRGVDAVTFNFPYIEQKRKIPDRGPVLEACFQSVIERIRGELPSARRALFIGGKSMGGRIATHVAADGLAESPRGIVLLGYPLHPPGRPHERRDAHLPDVRCPMLFVQGSRDTFGTPTELEPVFASLRAPATLHAIEGGDHSFKVSKGGSHQAQVFLDMQRAVVKWLRGVIVEGA